MIGAPDEEAKTVSFDDQYDWDTDDTPYPPVVTLANRDPSGCPKECCRLGCVCDSVNGTTLQGVKKEHCGEIGCMFGCICAVRLRSVHGAPSLLSSMHDDPEPDLTRAVELADHDLAHRSEYGRVDSAGSKKSLRLKHKPSLSHIDKISSLSMFDPKMWQGGSQLRQRGAPGRKVGLHGCFVSLS